MAISDDIDDFLVALRAYERNPAQSKEMSTFLGRRENLWAVFELIDAGMDLTPGESYTLQALAVSSRTWYSASKFWDGRVDFNNDAIYSDTRLQLVVESWEGSMRVDVRSDALAQVRRMCDQGLADPSRFRNLRPEWGNILFDGEYEFLIACVPGQQPSLEAEIQRFQARAARIGSTGYPSMADMSLRTLEAKLALGLRLRAEFFKDFWLPTALGATEWSEVQDFDVEILRGLYPHVWDGGYEMYRKAVAARV